MPSPDRVDPGRHPADARPGQDLGQPHHPGRRHADAQAPPTARRRCHGGGRQAARRRTRISRSWTAWSAAAARSVSYGELVGGKSFALKLDPAKPAKAKVRRITRSSASRSRASTSPPRSPAASPICTTSACPACCMAAWCVRPRWVRAAKRGRELGQGYSRPGQGRARGQLPRRRRAQRMGRDHSGEQASRPRGRNGKACPNRPSSTSMCARPSCQGRGHQHCRRHRGRDGGRRRRKLARRPTTSRSTPTARSGRHVRSPSSMTAH